MNSLKMFRYAAKNLFKHWQVWAAVYVFNLLSAKILTVLPALLLIAPAQRTMIGDAANGIDGWMILDAVMSPLVSQALGVIEPSSALEQMIPLSAITFMMMPALAGILNAFVNGGLLLTYHENTNPYQWKRFFWGCWHWFAAFLLLNFTQFIFALLIFGALIGGAIWLIGLAGEWSTWIVIPVLIVLMVVWLGVMELTGAQMIVGGTRNFARAFLDSLRCLFRRPINFLVFYGLATLALIAAHLIFNSVMPYVPLSWFPLVLIVQQTFVVTRLGLRLVRAGGSVGLASLLTVH